MVAGPPETSSVFTPQLSVAVSSTSNSSTLLGAVGGVGGVGTDAFEGGEALLEALLDAVPDAVPEAVLEALLEARTELSVMNPGTTYTVAAVKPNRARAARREIFLGSVALFVIFWLPTTFNSIIVADLVFHIFDN